MRRALRRARDGATLNIDEAVVLLHARGDDLADLCASAARVRDAGLRETGYAGAVLAPGPEVARDTGEGRRVPQAGTTPLPITYSRKVFIPLTHLCRDKCHYCTFVTVPGKLRAAGRGMYLEPDEVLDIARQGAELGCKEALFTLGDRPEERWPEARQWLDERGYDSTVDYVRAMSIRVLEETGLLPHLNPGVLSWTEMSRLKPVAPSMGMMLETTAERLFTEPGNCHYGSPDKDPAVRLRALTDAGRLSIPFTTGILVGIGETRTERAESIMAIRKSHKAFGHIQEVIVQNFLAKQHTAMHDTPDADLAEFRATIAVARLLLGPKMRIQAPPNLVSLDECRTLIEAGIDDWGGVSPLTPDHVNPERPWPNLEVLAEVTAQAGYVLTQRLTAHPKYVLAGHPWIDPRVAGHVAALADPRTGLARDGNPVGRPWQEPDHDWESVGRIDLNTAIDTEGRNTESRSDSGLNGRSREQAAGVTTRGPGSGHNGNGSGNDVPGAFGDWETVREQALSLSAPVKLDTDVTAALRAAERNPAGLSDAEYLALATADGPELDAVAAFADQLRRAAVGDDVTYIVNRNINFTNICYTGCRFCAFAQRKGDSDAFTLSAEEVADRAWEAYVEGATEVCMQGGIDPDLPVTGYADLVRAVKKRVPTMHVHAFSPMEVVNGASRSGQSIHDWLAALREAGLDTIPGTAAEILDDEVRWVLTKGKLPTSAWIEVITTAHRLGIRSSSTMMYGHVDNPRHWVGHLRVLRGIQDETGGFTEFVLLPFVHQSAPLYLAGASRPGPTIRDNRAAHALARIMLHGRIANIQTSWVKLGIAGTRVMLNGGANDLGGTLMEETISRMAGSEHGSAKTVAELAEIAEGIGRPVRERTTMYGQPRHKYSELPLSVG
jgi:FO synthase